MLAQYECVYIERSRRHILFRLFSAFLEVHRLVQTMQRHARQAIRLLNDAWRLRLGPFVVPLLTTPRCDWSTSQVLATTSTNQRCSRQRRRQIDARHIETQSFNSEAKSLSIGPFVDYFSL